MIGRPWSICAWPGCNALVRGRHCQRHAKMAAAERERHLDAARKAHDKQRPSSSKRGYDAAWRRRRKRVLAEEPECRVCARVATEVDHITPLARGGGNDRANLQALCKPCHSAKTTQDYAGWGHRKKKPR